MNLTTDGVVGPRTWQALERAPQNTQRSVSEDDLRARGSQTIATADAGEKQAKRAGLAIAGGVSLQTGLDALERLSGADSLLSGVQGVLLNNWPILLVGLVGAAVWLKGPALMQAIKDYRVDDAISGRNMGR
jgi:alanine dehydrogenase